MHERTAAFSPDYATARERFRAAAVRAGADLEELPLNVRDPHGAPLGIDVAWLGASAPRSVLLHASGLHGVEGFAGSAIQLQILSREWDLPEGAAVAMLHVLNPHGMAWLRRFNENNVDLNRNFLPPDEEFRGAPDGYRRLDALLNPRTPPRWRDGFLPQAVWSIARYGFHPLKQAVAQGQYEFPQGLFYGGARREATTVAVSAWLQRRLAADERLFVIDVHTGLGTWGEDSLLVHYDHQAERTKRLVKRFGERVQACRAEGVAYQVRGGILEAIERELSHVDVTSVCQEFGTYAPLKVLHALREENRLHHWGDPQQLNHRAKRRLAEMFCPASPDWRRRILERGETLFEQALAELRSIRDADPA